MGYDLFFQKSQYYVNQILGGKNGNRWTDSEAVATVQVRDHGGLALKVNRLRIYFEDMQMNAIRLANEFDMKAE